MLQRGGGFRYPIVLMAYGDDDRKETSEDLRDRANARQVVDRLVQRIASGNHDSAPIRHSHSQQVPRNSIRCQSA